MNKIKKYVTNDFLNNINKLNNLNETNNNKLYFKYEVTKKHINNLIICFNEIMETIKDPGDLITIFKISKTNNKLNKTNIKINSISIAPYYLCNNLLNCNCSNCNICYGAKNEMFKNIIKYRLNNYIYFKALEYLYINNHYLYKEILYNTIDLNKKDITNIIRINQQSDISNNIQLNILNEMLEYIQSTINNNCIFYTYSKTKNLNYDLLNKNFIINKSIGLIKDPKDLMKYKNNTNIFITIDKKITIEMLNKLNINYYICIGNCGNCGNCRKYNKHITLCYKH